MSDIADRTKQLRMRLVAQAKDQIDMGDYREQVAAYQRIMNDHLKLTIELAELVETALYPQAARLDESKGD